MSDAPWTGGLFKTLTLRGTTGSIAWGYRPVVTFRTWAVTRHRDQDTGEVTWTLSASVSPQQRVNPEDFCWRQRPLLFSAPRRGGLWCFPLREVQVGPAIVTATLDPPEF